MINLYCGGSKLGVNTHLFVVSFGTVDPRAYYLNYRRPVGASSTSQALPPRRYEDLPLHAIRRPRPLSVGRISDGTPSPTGTSPQLSAITIGDSSSEQSDAIAGTPPLTQHFVHPGVSPSSTLAPSATSDDEMPTLAPVQKDRLGRVMIGLDGSSHRYSGSSTGDSLIHPGVRVIYVSQDEVSLGDQQWFSSAGHVQGVGSGRD
ncbi:hypothetical protein MTR67_047565 [Solanum verrucosum]|uniref:Uncharacterized protein n=1 Tax=Solanum verrucosum TaxID=315347 RepID=A0AAF0UY19_SOLVR|nr:hypothetical protein MTR67_047565 [Solanum verrucosum]